MSVHLRREIENLKKHVLHMAAIVEENLLDAAKSVFERDADLAHQVIEKDDVIDRMEVEIEEDCLKILALYQPVAVDLRYIIAFLKLNNDLERIGDLAVNIAERAAYLVNKAPLTIPENLPRMAKKVQKMLKLSLDSLVTQDSELCREVRLRDDQVDEMHAAIYPLLQKILVDEAEKTDEWMNILGVSRYLERAADHCTNIAEDVQYMIDGQIQRHRSKI
jgi:phosphate transport system protein